MVAKWSATVRSVGFYVPDRIVTNDDLAKKMDTSDQWIRERTGIEQRRFVSDLSVGTSDLGVFAAKSALEKAKVDPQELDFIIAATLSPDYFFPGIGVQLQHKLGARTIPAIDIRGQCSGFAWSVATANAFIRSGQYRKILVVGAELQTRLLECSDRGRDVAILFGDGAGAMVLEGVETKELPSGQNKIRGVIDNEIGCDGSGAEMLMIKRPGMSGGYEEFITADEAANKAYLPIMDGRQVFKNAVSRMVEAGTALLARNGLTINDVDLIVPHQANLRINEMVRQKFGLPEDRVFNNIQRYGNTTAATLPIGMSEAESMGRLKRGDLLLTLAFGAGFTWGANLIRW